MITETIHTCSYYCERPECVRRQRDELRDRMESALASAPPSAPEPEVHSYDPTDQRQSVTIRWQDGKCLSYVLDRTRYTDNLPPSVPVGADAVMVPKEPSEGVLVSMAIRYDHGLGVPGYYDQPLFGAENGGHKRRMESTVAKMRQLYEEVVGAGFYSREREEEYAALARQQGGVA